MRYWALLHVPEAIGAVLLPVWQATLTYLPLSSFLP